VATVAGARADLAARLTAAGIVVAETGGAAAPPQAIIVPGEPFVEPFSLTRTSRTVRFSIVQLITSASDRAMSAAIDELAQKLSLVTAPGGTGFAWSAPVVSAPRAYEVGGASHLALTAEVSTMIA
jgi:hypothetical protein